MRGERAQDGPAHFADHGAGSLTLLIHMQHHATYIAPSRRWRGERSDLAEGCAAKLAPLLTTRYIFALTNPTQGDDTLNPQGPLATLWAGAGLSAFYLALIWLNTLLGLFLTPLFLIPITWFIGGKKKVAPTYSSPPE